MPKCIVDPPEECAWAYRIGEWTVEIFKEAVPIENVTEEQALLFLGCIVEVTEKRERTLELKCFDSGLEEGWKKLSANRETYFLDNLNVSTLEELEEGVKYDVKENNERSKQVGTVKV